MQDCSSVVKDKERTGSRNHTFDTVFDTFEGFHDTTIQDLKSWVNAQIEGIRCSSQTATTNGALQAFKEMKSKLEVLL